MELAHHLSDVHQAYGIGGEAGVDVALDVLDDVTALSVEAERSRRAGIAHALQVEEQGVHRRGPRTRRGAA